MKRTVIATAGAVLTMAGGVATATPAQAAPLVTGGLVNVTVTDVLNDNTVDVLNDVDVAIPVALDLAAQVCGTTVGVLAQDLAADGTCTNTLNGDTFAIDQR